MIRMPATRYSMLATAFPSARDLSAVTSFKFLRPWPGANRDRFGETKLQSGWPQKGPKDLHFLGSVSVAPIGARESSAGTWDLCAFLRLTGSENHAANWDARAPLRSAWQIESRRDLSACSGTTESAG